MKSSLLEEIKTHRGRDEVPGTLMLSGWGSENVSHFHPTTWRKEFPHFSSQVLWELTFEGSKEGKVYARIVLPKSEEKVPLIFHFRLYGTWLGLGRHTGLHRSWLQLFPWMWGPVRLLTRRLAFSFRKYREGAYYPWCCGRSGPPLYKDVYLDIYQLVEIVASLSQVDEKRLSSYGASQGRALALVAATLNPRFRKQVPFIPSCQTSDGWLRLVY